MALRAPLLFDLDGTLVDSALDIAAALSRLAIARGGSAIAPDAVRPLVSLGVEALVGATFGSTGRALADDVERFRALLAATPPHPGSIYPHVVEALGALAASGHPMAVVTNKPEGLSRGLLDQLGLCDFFGAVIGGDTLPTRKPDRAPLDGALDRLAGGREGALMIGDSAVDAVAARAAGVAFALFEGGYGAADCDDRDVALRFDRFDHLPGLVGDRRAVRAAMCYGAGR